MIVQPDNSIIHLKPVADDTDLKIAARLDEADLLFLVVKRFAAIALHPETVSNMEMGSVFEELIRKFSELSNETACEHFTPREVIRLMVNLLFLHDNEALTRPGIVKTIYDPACGTGGMLSVSEENELNGILVEALDVPKLA